ncbi:MAG: COX15/CtaA family protein [Bryobacteraceae bacterium]|jgi:heme A synthase
MSGLALASVAVLCVWAFRRYARGSTLRKLAALPLTVSLGMTGAVAALGDTLFPASSVGAGLSQDFSAAANFLVRLRAVHPALAIVAGACIFYAASAAMKAHREARNTALAVWLLVLAQIVVGSVNIALLAPVWMQIVHLLVADLLWIALVLLALCTASGRTEGSSYVNLV